jgi:hypothetical protein
MLEGVYIEKREQIMVTTREQAVWGIHGGRTGDANSLYLNHNVIALGWNIMGDLSVLSPDREAFKVRVAEVYPDSKPGAVPVMAGELYRFVYEMQIGDLVVYFSKHDRQIHIGKIEGAYIYQTEPEPSYPHHRTVRWMKTLPLTHFSQKALHEIGSAMTFFQVKNYDKEFRAALEGRVLPPPISTDQTIALVSEGIVRGTPSEMRSNNVIVVPTFSEEEITFEGHEGIEGLALPLAQGKRTIHTKSDDPQIDAFYGKFKRGKLILQPDFQRLFVWDRAKASRLIESALLAVPLPIIYLAEEANGKELVIDGQQRLTSFFAFLDGIFPDGKPFKLTGLEVFHELNNKSFKELDENLQDKIRYYPIRAITILYDSHPELKFEIFERLNTGAVPLNDMELRNCVYHGEYIELLKQLATDPDFMRLLGLKKSDQRMHDVELVLRFATFYHETYLKYQPPMKRFLNRDMEKYQHITKADADELRKAFKNSVQIVKSLFGTSAFKRIYAGSKSNPNGNWETKQFNASLYDVMMGVFWNKDKNRAYAALDSLREGFIDLMTSHEEFVDAILIGTSEQGKVKKRFHLAEALVDDILENYKKQPRCFSMQLKKELFDRDQTCLLCHQQISSIDDAAIDHIQQYWKGGQTIPENARLTHRYCNIVRPRNE